VQTFKAFFGSLKGKEGEGFDDKGRIEGKGRVSSPSTLNEILFFFIGLKPSNRGTEKMHWERAWRILNKFPNSLLLLKILPK